MPTLESLFGSAKQSLEQVLGVAKDKLHNVLFGAPSAPTDSTPQTIQKGTGSFQPVSTALKTAIDTGSKINEQRVNPTMTIGGKKLAVKGTPAESVLGNAMLSSGGINAGKALVSKADDLTILAKEFIKKNPGASAEDFIKSVPSAFHQTATDTKITKWSTKPSMGRVWFTDNKNVLGNVGASGKGKIYDVYFPEGKWATPEQADNSFTDRLIQEGYDGVFHPDSTGEYGNYYEVFNTAKIRSKKQLLEAFNKAKTPDNSSGNIKIKTLLGGSVALATGAAIAKTINNTKTPQQPVLSPKTTVQIATSTPPITPKPATPQTTLIPSTFVNKPAATKLSNWTTGEASFYHPLNPNETRRNTDGTGAYGRKIAPGSVAFGNRAFHEDLKNGHQVFIKVKGFEDVETPYGNGIFRIDDTMNKRYNVKGHFNIDFNDADLGKARKDKGRFPIEFKVVKITGRK